MTACWPSPGQNPDRTSYNPTETAITPETVGRLALDWEAPVDDGNVGAPVRSTRRVHVTDNKSAYAFDIRTGARLWKVPAMRYPEGGPETTSGAAFVEGDRLLASSSSDSRIAGAPHTVFSFDVATGEGGPLWQDRGFNLQAVRGDRGAGSYTIADSGGELRYLYEKRGDQLYVRGLADVRNVTIGTDAIYGNGSGFLPPFPWDLDPPGGVDDIVWGYGLWAYPFHEDAIECPVVGAPEDYPPLACPVWAAPLDATLATEPTLAPDGPELYVGTYGGQAYAVDRGDGSVLWSAPLGGTAAAPPALADGVLYYVTTTGALVAIDAAGCGAPTCPPLWTASLSGDGSVQPAVAGGLVFTASDSGALRAFDAAGCGAATCAALWSAEVGGAISGAPAVTGGRLYVGVRDRGLLSYALDGTSS
jgi:outer membrane protein assembly factor BamB